MLQSQQMVKLNNVFQVICPQEIDARKQNKKNLVGHQKKMFDI